MDELLAKLRSAEHPLAALKRIDPMQAMALRDAVGGSRKLAEALGIPKRDRCIRALYKKLTEIGWGNAGADFEPQTRSRSTEEIRAAYKRATDFKERALDVYHETDREEWVHIAASDIHLGPREVAYDKWLRLLDWVLETPNASIGLNGDLFNCATKSGPGVGPSVDVLSFPEQRKLMAYDLRPIAEAGKLDYIGSGNHEDRIARATGVAIWPGEDLAYQLGVPFIGYARYVRWRINDQPYCGYHHHGTGTGQTLGSVVNTLERLANNHRGDYVLMGHRHQRLSIATAFTEVDERGIEVDRIVHLICTGSYQRTANQNYAVKANLRPSVIGAVGLRFGADERGMYVRE